jgi:hypothetical protein
LGCGQDKFILVPAGIEPECGSQVFSILFDKFAENLTGISAVAEVQRSQGQMNFSSGPRSLAASDSLIRCKTGSFKAANPHKARLWSFSAFSSPCSSKR